MRFEISTHCETGEVERTPVGWIKQFREETGAGLKQAKDVCDILRNHFGGSLFGKTVVLDTAQFPEVDFLNDINFDTRMFTRLDRMVVVPAESPQSKVLKNAAVRLVRLGAFSEARDVLKILM